MNIKNTIISILMLPLLLVIIPIIFGLAVIEAILDERSDYE